MRRGITIGILTAVMAGAGVGAAASISLGAGMHRPQATRPAVSSPTADVAAARLATAKYVTNLARAKSDGYGIITRMIPDMGYHFLNPKVSGFDIRKPPILVYEHDGPDTGAGLAEGLRNAEIAQRLVVSQKTVDHHVSAILRSSASAPAGRPAAPPTGSA